MNPKMIGSIIVAIILINTTLFSIIPLPGIVITAAVVATAALLLMSSTKGGILGKASLVIGIIVAIFAVDSILNLLGISIPFVSYLYIVYSYSLIAAAAMLLINAFTH